MNIFKHPHHTPVTYALLLALLMPWAAVNAGVFSVTPVRLYMTPRDRAIAVTLTNEGDTAIVLQADINSWSQKPDGSDELVLTEDLILAPPIIKLASKTRQVVRLASAGLSRASRTTCRVLEASLMIGGARIRSSVSTSSSLPSGFWLQLLMSACRTMAVSPSLVSVTAIARSRGVMYSRTGVTEKTPALTAAHGISRASRSAYVTGVWCGCLKMFMLEGYQHLDRPEVAFGVGHAQRRQRALLVLKMQAGQCLRLRGLGIQGIKLALDCPSLIRFIIGIGQRALRVIQAAGDARHLVAQTQLLVAAVVRQQGIPGRAKAWHEAAGVG